MERLDGVWTRLQSRAVGDADELVVRTLVGSPMTPEAEAVHRGPEPRRAPNDGPLDSETGEGQPIESGGWWTPYVETTWGYFRFAVRPVEQPDGLILFWHDAEGAHSQNVILDRPSLPIEAEAVAAYRADLEAKVRALPDFRDRDDMPWPWINRAAVLRLLTDGAEPPEDAE